MRDSLHMLASRRGLGLLALNGLAAFGLLSAVVQLITAIWHFDHGLRHPWLIALGIVAVSLAWALARAFPRRRIECRFRHPEMAVTLTVGDLFEQRAHLVVGFSDTFDTDTTDNLIINSSSLQGQLLDRLYGGDLHTLWLGLSRTWDAIRLYGQRQRTAIPLMGSEYARSSTLDREHPRKL